MSGPSRVRHLGAWPAADRGAAAAPVVWLGAAVLLLLVGSNARALHAHVSGALGAALSMVAIAAPAALATLRWLGAQRGLAVLGVLSAYAFLVETTGLLIGLPYGEFRYGAAMAPMIGGLVPLSLPLGYVPLVLGAVAVIPATRSIRRGPDWLWPALLLVAFDLVVDPGAVAMGYWRYEAGGTFYGVPWTNYAGWALTACGAVLVTKRMARGAIQPPGALAASSLWLLSYWTGVTAAAGLPEPAVVGALLSGLVASAVLARRGHERHAEAQAFGSSRA